MNGKWIVELTINELTRHDAMKPHYLTIRNQEGETTYDFRLLIEQTSAEPPSSKIYVYNIMFTNLFLQYYFVKTVVGR